jgi:hypothetical protein
MDSLSLRASVGLFEMVGIQIPIELSSNSEVSNLNRLGTA